MLDLGCGYGRHANELSRRGFSVTGVDITAEYIERASADARQKGLDSDFICCDIRDVDFHNEFDVVVNMADGAIGCLDNDKAQKFERIPWYDIVYLIQCNTGFFVANIFDFFLVHVMNAGKFERQWFDANGLVSGL